MRNTARWAATLGLTAAAVCAPLSGAALAAPGTAPSALYAPSALVLTVGHGVSAPTVTPERAVTLTCAPGPSGTHPAAGAACAELAYVGGDPAALTMKRASSVPRSTTRCSSPSTGCGGGSASPTSGSSPTRA
ncbi:hypothetical protein SHKM778_53170 [Streptomyces sp. KM77-8]|uniref:Subtilisin inhibitor domain-containing protein n=1 Tax=Streptomyces haneummycinicus TaxID=3074435 RepID=A0AAT9HND9_9ACTN